MTCGGEAIHSSPAAGSVAKGSVLLASLPPCKHVGQPRNRDVRLLAGNERIRPIQPRLVVAPGIGTRRPEGVGRAVPAVAAFAQHDEFASRHRARYPGWSRFRRWTTGRRSSRSRSSPPSSASILTGDWLRTGQPEGDRSCHQHQKQRHVQRSLRRHRVASFHIWRVCSDGGKFSSP